MDDKLIEAVNIQISDEFESAHLYLSMSAYCEYNLNLTGFAHWMRKQYEEEISHGLRLFDYLINRLAKPSIRGSSSPKSDFGTPEKLFEVVLDNEENVTVLINQLYELAVTERDYALQVELQWFITEQVEEEKSVSGVLDSIRLIDGNKDGLLLIDRELAKR